MPHAEHAIADPVLGPPNDNPGGIWLYRLADDGPSAGWKTLHDHEASTVAAAMATLEHVFGRGRVAVVVARGQESAAASAPPPAALDPPPVPAAEDFALAPPAPPAAPRTIRHRWDHPEPHLYRCRVCGMEKQNRIESDGSAWFQRFRRPGGDWLRLDATPPCDGAKGP